MSWTTKWIINLKIEMWIMIQTKIPPNPNIRIGTFIRKYRYIDMRILIHIRESIEKYTMRCEIQLMGGENQRYYQMYKSTIFSTVPIKEERDKLHQRFYLIQIIDFIKNIQCLKIIGDCDNTKSSNQEIILCVIENLMHYREVSNGLHFLGGIL